MLPEGEGVDREAVGRAVDASGVVWKHGTPARGQPSNPGGPVAPKEVRRSGEPVNAPEDHASADARAAREEKRPPGGRPTARDNRSRGRRRTGSRMAS